LPSLDVNSMFHFLFVNHNPMKSNHHYFERDPSWAVVNVVVIVVACRAVASLIANGKFDVQTCDVLRKFRSVEHLPRQDGVLDVKTGRKVIDLWM